MNNANTPNPPEPEQNTPSADTANHQAAQPVADSANPAAEPATVHAQQQRPVDPKDADDVMTKKLPGREAADTAVLADSRRRTRRSFLVAGAAVAGAYGFHRYLADAPQEDMLAHPMRNSYDLNAAISRRLGDRQLSPTYPLSRAENLRVNGLYGLKVALVPESWRLQLVGSANEQQHPRYTKDVTAWEYRYTATAAGMDTGHDTKVDPKLQSAEKMAPAEMQDKARQDENHTGRKPRGQEEAGESDSTLAPGTAGLLLTMADITKLPRHELVTQFKCIEGWSQIVHWAGYRMADFLEAYPPEKINGRDPKYVYLETPDGDYYVGYHMEIMHHPQTLLVTEMMGTPLTQFHGAPLRLHTPTKYGYKQIKRIGLISYTDDKPDDYWTKLGYDWYAGL